MNGRDHEKRRRTDAKRARKPSGPNARSVATEVLRRVAVDGAWASRALDNELQRAGLEARDAALATTIVYGTLRQLPTIDALIDARAKKTDPFVRALLRGAVFQIRHLDRVPVRAVVHETVNLARDARGKQVGGFINAVLRRIPRPDQVQPSQLELPSWAAARLKAAAGPELAAMFDGGEAPLDLRVFAPRDEWITRLKEAEPEIDVAPVGAFGARVAGAGDPRNLIGFEEGAFAVQEAGSQLIVEMVGAKEGQRVADCCAGRGGKTIGLAAAVGDKGHVTAIELHEARLEQIPQACNRHGLNADVAIEAVDLSVGNGGIEAEYDHVLIDAPCSGLGTVHRRPEILLRLSEEDLVKLAALQRKIIEHAASLVKAGGTLTYAVCSFARDEGPEVADALMESLGFVEAMDTVPSKHGTFVQDGWLRLGPWSSTDGYQVRRWRRI